MTNTILICFSLCLLVRLKSNCIPKISLLACLILEIAMKKTLKLVFGFLSIFISFKLNVNLKMEVVQNFFDRPINKVTNNLGPVETRFSCVHHTKWTTTITVLLSGMVLVLLVFEPTPRLPLSMVSLAASRHSQVTTMMVMMVVNFATPLSIVSSTKI